MKMISRLENRSQPFWAIIGILLVVLVGVLDVLTGYELSFALFYLLPISLITWHAGKRLGVVTSVISAFVWFASDVMSGHPYSHPAIPYWNSAIRFGFFLITSLLMSALKKALEDQEQLARTDNLTGAVNKSFFSELLQTEIDRSQRFGRPFTVAYIDLDDFKMINDRLGHSMGDKVLFTSVKQAKRQLRTTDIIARLGGDEFAFLLPETGQSEARIVISRVHGCLLEEMHRNDWSVTFSIGVLTCIDMPHTAEELIMQADDLMYSVKNSGKNSVRYSIRAS